MTLRVYHLFLLSLAMWALVLALLAYMLGPVFAAEPDKLGQCPNPGQPCKVITLTQDEEDILVGKPLKQVGILPTAAQARSLDLGQFVSYFLQKIQSAPHGEMKPDPVASAKPYDAPAGAKK
jgi:hypothetical protein